jgi:hypothetical protein
MIKYSTTILKFGTKGEKTGWTYIEVPADIAQQIKPGSKKSFRVKGKFDNVPFEQIATIPMGGGDFIIPIKASLRKEIGKRHGAMLHIEMEEDTKPLQLDSDMMECLEDEPKALEYFNKLPKSHQNYYSKWIAGAKTDETKSKRIAQCITACSKGMHFGEMMRALKKDQ